MNVAVTAKACAFIQGVSLGEDGAHGIEGFLAPVTSRCVKGLNHGTIEGPEEQFAIRTHRDIFRKFFAEFGKGGLEGFVTFADELERT